MERVGRLSSALGRAISPSGTKRALQSRLSFSFIGRDNWPPAGTADRLWARQIQG